MIKLFEKFAIKSKEEKELDELILRMKMNMENNYKDNAQDNYVALKNKYSELLEKGLLKKTVADKYSLLINEYGEKLKDFTHKDQKPYWH